MASTPLIASHPSPSSSSDVEEEEAEPEAKVARLCSGEHLENCTVLIPDYVYVLGNMPVLI